MTQGAGWLLLRFLQLFSRVLNVAPKILRGLVHGVVLGLSSVRTLDALDEAYYADNEKYVDTEYNIKGLWAWEQAEIDAHFEPGSRVVVSAAGGGREVHALLQQGFDAHGFECNLRLADYAERFLADAGHPGRISQAPRDGWPPRGAAPYDGLVVGWGSYMLVRSRARRVGFLREAARRLSPGAPVLLSFFPRAEGDFYFSLVAAVGSVFRRARRAGPVEIGDGLVPNFAHFFTEGELRDELRVSGFRLLAYTSGGYGRAVAYLDADVFGGTGADHTEGEEQR